MYERTCQMHLFHHLLFPNDGIVSVSVDTTFDLHAGCKSCSEFSPRQCIALLIEPAHTRNALVRKIV